MERWGEKPNYHEEEPKNYEFFDDPRERRELFEYSKSIAEYLRREKVPNLVIIDRSSRPLYVGVREYLQSRYPDEQMPDIYFMNPKGFKSKEQMTRSEIQEVILDYISKDDLRETPNQVRSEEEILKEFEDTYKHLMLDKEKPILIFDTCIHSGNSLEPVKRTFSQSGFDDVRIGAVNPTERRSKIKTDFYITTEEPEKGCYPFDRDRIIEKTFDHVYSKKSNDKKRREKSIRLRKEIKNIVDDFLKKES